MNAHAIRLAADNARIFAAYHGARVIEGQWFEHTAGTLTIHLASAADLECLLDAGLRIELGDDHAVAYHRIGGVRVVYRAALAEVGAA